jgi:hypothetical protein
MARKCFCGCGRDIGLRQRGLAKQGEELDRLLTRVKDETVPLAREDMNEETVAELEGFAAKGDEHRARLLAALHGEADRPDPQPVDEWISRAERVVDVPRAADAVTREVMQRYSR